MSNIDPTAIEINTDPLTERMTGITNHKHLQFDVLFISHIKDNLYVGGCTNNLILPSNIKHLISLYPWEQYTVNHDLDSSLTVRMYDLEDQTLEQVTSIADWANRCTQQGPTLIHCQAGLNRSSLVAALVLIKQGLTPSDAIILLRKQRSPAVLCNAAFESYLRELT